MSNQNEKTVYGVFLVEEKDLLELDGILKNTHDRMREMGSSPDYMLGHHNESYVRVGDDSSSSLYSEFNKFSTFRDAIKSDRFDKNTPRQFVAEVTWGQYKQIVRLKYDMIDKEIEVQTSHPAEIDSVDLFALVDRLKQPLHINVWAKYWWVAVITLWLTPLIYLIMSSALSSDRIDRALHGEAEKVLSTGVNESNKDMALELVLRYQSKIPASPLPPHSVMPFLIVLGICVALAAVAYLRPRSAIGIGKGKDSIAWQRNWWFVLTKWIVPVVFSGTVFKSLWAIFAEK